MRRNSGDANVIVYVQLVWERLMSWEITGHRVRGVRSGSIVRATKCQGALALHVETLRAIPFKGKLTRFQRLIGDVQLDPVRVARTGR